MHAINAKWFAEVVDDRIADGVYGMLVDLMTEFNRDGLVRELTPFERAHIEVDTEEAAERLKGAVYDELVRLGLDVESDGRSW